MKCITKLMIFVCKFIIKHHSKYNFFEHIDKFYFIQINFQRVCLLILPYFQELTISRMKYIEIHLIKKSSSNFTKIVAIIINPKASIFTKIFIIIMHQILVMSNIFFTSQLFGHITILKHFCP
jgi:hypothetical protein